MSLLVALALAGSLAPMPAPKPQVLVLGVFHFANPGLDAVKVKQKDALGPERQKEIADLNARLAKYKPTKIFIEATVERQAEIDGLFQDFLAGRHVLSASESQQVGFRLAKQLGLPKLYAVDYQSPMDFDGVMKFAAEHGMNEVTDSTMEAVQKLGGIMSDWDSKYTVPQILAIHNDPNFQRDGQSFYTHFLKVGKAPDFPGADMLAGWYRRNLVIFQNVKSQLQPGDRAMVIFGSGHAYYLNQLIRDSSDLTLIEAGKYLPKPPITEFPRIEG